MPGAAGLGGTSSRTACTCTTQGGLLYPLRGPLLRGFVAWTRLVYRRLARRVARDVADYERSGITVAGMVGIGASPSCGVTTTLDMRASLEVVASCPAAALTRDVMNERAVLGCRRKGEGLFIAALDRQLRRRGVEVPALEHDLAAELRGSQQTLLAAGALRTVRALGNSKTLPRHRKPLNCFRMLSWHKHRSGHAIRGTCSRGTA